MKIKFPIILKIALLGILVSGLVSGVALTVSNIHQRQVAEDNLIDNIDQTLASIDYTYHEDEEGAGLIDDLMIVKKYISEIYNEEDVHDKSINDFSSFDEYEAYFKEKAKWIFPDPNSMIASKDYLEFRKMYRELSHILVEAAFSSGARAAYASYEEDNESGKRLVFINDSRISHPNEDNRFYHLPCSHYNIKNSDFIIDDSEEEYYGYNINGYVTRYIPIYYVDELGETEEVAKIFLEYDNTYLLAQSRSVLFSELLVLSIAMVVTVILYMVLAHFTITRNLNKLTKITDDISRDLKDKKEISITPLNFSSHDEISSLAASFNVMENEIINYVDIIKKEAMESQRREAELEVASKIQLNALPDSSYQDKNVDLYAYIKPAKIVGGDFYDYFYYKDELIVLIADVSGKGIPASLLMMKAKALIKSKILSGLSLNEAFYEVNNELVINNDESLFVTSFAAAFDFVKGKINYVNAGHEKPYILSNNEVIKLDGNSNFVLGGEENISYVLESRDFNKGDTLFIFTDGLNESINNAQEEFGYNRIKETLLEGKDLSNKDKINLFNDKLKEFIQDEEQFDDVTMMVINRKDNHLHLSYDKKDYSIIEDISDKFYDYFSFLDKDKKAHVGIAIDELINNLISYEKREDLKIDLDFIYDNDELKLVITSNGEDFNPFLHNEEKTIKEEGNVEDITPGGFGISLVKNVTKKRSYSYQNNKSIITLIF